MSQAVLSPNLTKEVQWEVSTMANKRCRCTMVKTQDKNVRAPTHDYKLNQDVMYLEPASKKWFPATIVYLLDAK